MQDLCSELVVLIFHNLPTKSKCAVMATCRRFYQDGCLRALMAAARRIHRRTGSRQARQKALGHESQARRAARGPAPART